MPTWQEEVRRYAAAHDWIAAMRIVDHEISRAPQDMDVRAWRARVLTWSGRLPEAEVEYQAILAASPNDPDHWLGLAGVYSREHRAREAVLALDRAIELDPKRADIRVARAAALRTVGDQREAQLEFRRAVELDPTKSDGRDGVISLRRKTKHELWLGVNTDLFSFAGTNHDEGLTLVSRWSPHWSTSVAADGYHWGGSDAEKFVGSLTGRSPVWGALTVGGAAAHDNGVIPREESFFEYDEGFKLRGDSPLRGIEIGRAHV